LVDRERHDCQRILYGRLAKYFRGVSVQCNLVAVQTTTKVAVESTILPPCPRWSEALRTSGEMKRVEVGVVYN
jgi:hypothetical protein